MEHLPTNWQCQLLVTTKISNMKSEESTEIVLENLNWRAEKATSSGRKTKPLMWNSKLWCLLQPFLSMEAMETTTKSPAKSWLFVQFYSLFLELLGFCCFFVWVDNKTNFVNVWENHFISPIILYSGLSNIVLGIRLIFDPWCIPVFSNLTVSKGYALIWY